MESVEVIKMIKIKKSPTADTRSAQDVVSKEKLLASSKQHIGEVQNAIYWMIDRLKEIADKHDWTKLEYIDEFHNNFEAVQKDSTLDFKKLGWFEKHVTIERHHVNDNCKDDINLFDLLERIADITVAGIGRTGKVYSDSLDKEILSKAYTNTVNLLIDNIELDSE